MKSRSPNHIAELRKSLGLSQSQLAEKVDAHWVTISRLERGELQLNESWLHRLSSALGVNPSQIVNWDATSRSVYLCGSIRNTSESTLYDKTNEIPLGDFPHEQIVTLWFTVEDDSFWPLLKKLDIASFVEMPKRNYQNLTSRLCMAFSANEKVGHVGFLERGSSSSLFDIRPISGIIIRDVAISRLLLCTEMHFRLPPIHELI